MLGRWKGNAQGSKIYAILVLASLWASVKGEKSERALSRMLMLTWLSLILMAAMGAAIPGVGGRNPIGLRRLAI